MRPIVVGYVGDAGARRVAEGLERADDRLEVTVVGADDPDTGGLDCVVTDHDPPVVNGLAVLRSVAGRAPELPVLLYTAAGSEATASEAVSAGAAGYVRKQEGVERLAERVVAAVERARERADHRRAAERLETVASVVSHDLRNPLNVAMGRLQMVAEECDSDQIPVVARSLDQLEAEIDGAVSFARAGWRVTDPAEVDLAAVAEGCWRALDTGDATLTVTAERPLRADPERLRELLAELFDNAVTHGGDGVAVEVGETDGGFYVADDGPGLSVDPEQATEPGHAAGEAGGAGYGLAVAAGIAAAHGWELDVSDGGGVRVEVRT